jgi:hypothetical protein
LIEQLVNPACPVEQGILGVKMKMNEILVSHRDLGSPPPPGYGGSAEALCAKAELVSLRALRFTLL